jgi:membrane protease YdiL (CAAX protease family)
LTGPTPDTPEAPAATLPAPLIPPIAPPGGGRSVFSLDGRAAAGLYVVGWLATGLGIALFLVSVASQSRGLAGLGLTVGAAILLSLGLIAAAGAQGAQRRADGVAGYAGPSPFLVFAASLAVTVLIVIVVVGGASLAGLDALSPLGALVQVAITGLVYAGLVQLLIVSPGALTWREMGVRSVPVARIAIDFLWGASFAIPVIFVTTIVAAVLIGGLGTTPDSPLPPSRDSTGLILNLISAALLAPIGEEIFYRGFALTAWARTMDPRAALIRSAVFFAFVHILTVGASTFNEGAAQALIAFAVRVPIALALGWVFLRRGSLYSAIGLHAAFNGILLLLAQTAPAAPPA